MTLRLTYQKLRLLLFWGLGATAVCQNTATSGSATQLVQEMVKNELRAEAEDHSQWMYRQEKQLDGKNELQEVIETPHGFMYRVLAVKGQPLNQKQRQDEAKRIQDLLSKPSEQEKQRKRQQEDLARAQQLLALLPQAFVFTERERHGPMVRLDFEPQPTFQARTHEARVLHNMVGTVWFDVLQKRLAKIDGTLIREVKFGGGLLGHLDKGGRFAVEQSEVAPGYWEITAMNIAMHGKALFLKTISVQQKQLCSQFQRVPNNLTLAQAAHMLDKYAAVVARR